MRRCSDSSLIVPASRSSSYDPLRSISFLSRRPPSAHQELVNESFAAHWLAAGRSFEDGPARSTFLPGPRRRTESRGERRSKYVQPVKLDSEMIEGLNRSGMH